MHLIFLSDPAGVDDVREIVLAVGNHKVGVRDPVSAIGPWYFRFG